MPQHRHHLAMADLQLTRPENLLSINDEDLSAETDEPPENKSNQFSKLEIHKSAPIQSLITKALTSPQLGPMDRGRTREYAQSFSGTSFWSLSGASTAELTSDGGLTSRSHSPSPPSSPRMLPHLFRSPQSVSGIRFSGPVKFTGPVQVVSEDDTEVQSRKRSIRFVCNAEPNPRRPSEVHDVQTVAEAKVDESKASKTSLRFACEEPAKKDTAPAPSCSIRFATNLSSFDRRVENTTSRNTATSSTVTSSATSTSVPTQIINNLPNPATRFHEFASSCEDTESWMIQVPDRARLLRVDGVLEKERDIRKLVEEAEDEDKQEEEEEDELNAISEDDEDEEDEDVNVDDEEDEEEEEEEDEEEDAIDEYLSGNESDNEEGFASDSDDDSDCFFFDSPRRPIAHSEAFTPACCRPRPDYTLVPTHAHPSAINLPDSTDFVCGTIDEDQPLEDAYAHALVERKRGKTILDLDPGFPTADSDLEDEFYVKSHSSAEHVWIRGKMSFSDEEPLGTRKPRSILAKERCPPDGKIRFNSPPPRRAQSPAPKRRMVSPPPRGHKTSPPLSRRNSTDQSPRPNFSRRGSRAMSPPPPARNLTFLNNRPVVERTKSLPKGAKMPMSRGRLSDFEHLASPEPTQRRVRGAVDIVKGLENRRERRKNTLARQRGSYTRKGEGVEKMRELGLMLGKGKQAQWMISV